MIKTTNINKHEMQMKASISARIVFGEIGRFPLYISWIYLWLYQLITMSKKNKNVYWKNIYSTCIVMEVRVRNSWLDCIQRLFNSCVRQTQGFIVYIKNNQVIQLLSGDRNNSSGCQVYRIFKQLLEDTFS